MASSLKNKFEDLAKPEPKVDCLSRSIPLFCIHEKINKSIANFFINQKIQAWIISRWQEAQTSRPEGVDPNR